MRELGFSGVIKAQGNFPDCIARKHGDQVWIEFEYKAKSFVTHRHLESLKRKKCTIVCWEDNWQNPPKNVKIISLQRELNLSKRVRLAHAKRKEHFEELDNVKKRNLWWSMPQAARKGDIIIVWRAGRGQSHFKDILLASEHSIPKFGFKGYGKCKRICQLKNPITLDDIRNNSKLADLSISKSGFFTGPNKDLTPFWSQLYCMIIAKNKSFERIIKKYRPGHYTMI
jgi:hypothetical protein